MFNGSSPRGFRGDPRGHFGGGAKPSCENFLKFSKLLVKISA